MPKRNVRERRQASGPQQESEQSPTAIRDLGYRGYGGRRVSRHQNTLVLMRHGLRRAWGSWLVKLAVFLGWIPLLIGIVLVLVARWFSQGTAEPLGPEAVHLLLKVQLWFFVSMATLGAGSSVVSEDLSQRAFQFYFAKPITAEQYLLARTAAVGIVCLLLLLVPSLLLVLIAAGIHSDPGTLVLLAPATAHSILIAAVFAVTSVAISSVGRSRALTMSAWMLFLFVPHVFAALISNLTEWPWLELAALPSLMTAMGDALLGIEPESEMRWYFAAPVLVALSLGAVLLARRQLVRAEVVT